MAGRVQPRQLAFALPHAESFTREDFLEGPANAAGLALVDSWPDWPNRIMLLVGPEGSGKSHLAAIWAEQAGARSISAHALTAAAVPGALATGALVIEDLKSPDVDERALFHLLNLAREDQALRSDHRARAAVGASDRAARPALAAARDTDGVAAAAGRSSVSRADRQILRRPATCGRRDRRELSHNPDRALLRGRTARRGTAGHRSPAARPAGHPGAGGRIAPQQRPDRPLASQLDAARGENIMVIETSPRSHMVCAVLAADCHAA